METKQRHRKARPKQATTKAKAKQGTAKERQNIKDKRRELYHQDVEFRARVQTSARNYYRKKNPKPTAVIAGGVPAIPPTSREVVLQDGSSTELTFRMCYTVPQLAKALGKSLMTTRTWISKGYLPETRYVDVRHNYKQYTQEEVVAIVEALAEHFETYSYLNDNHTTVLQSISQKVAEAQEKHG